ncbi:MAG: glycosyltransferase, partial [Rhodospirillales bacterium]|nr:glycosyltransferase [Rhodospirillales bacterium]
MPDTTAPPRVSVLMTTWNGAGFIAESIASILAQDFSDFELVVIDDGSTDDTPAILTAIADPRLRVLRPPHNLGIAGARNFGFAACRAPYVAALDHDDISLPGRLAAQFAYLERTPGIVLVGSDISIREGGRERASGHAGGAPPSLMRWLLHIDNPLTYSSVMLRTSAVRALGAFMRADRAPADDFDLYHRLLRVGEIARLEEVLTIYRWHATNASHAQGAALVAMAVDVLAEACTPWFGPAAGEAARLVIWHLSERHPATDRATLARLGEVLERLLAGFCATHPMPPATRAAIARAAGRAW